MHVGGASVAAVTRSTIPQPGFDALRVYVPRRQRVLVKQGEEFWRTHEIKPYRVFPEELAEGPESFVFHGPSSTARELITAGALDRSGVVAWSLWEDYLKMPSGAALQELLAEYQISLTSVRTSGHASRLPLNPRPGRPAALTLRRAGGDVRSPPRQISRGRVEVAGEKAGPPESLSASAGQPARPARPRQPGCRLLPRSRAELTDFG